MWELAQLGFWGFFLFLWTTSKYCFCCSTNRYDQRDWLAGTDFSLSSWPTGSGSCHCQDFRAWSCGTTTPSAWLQPGVPDSPVGEFLRHEFHAAQQKNTVGCYMQRLQMCAPVILLQRNYGFPWFATWNMCPGIVYPVWLKSTSSPKLWGLHNKQTDILEE